MSRPEIGTQAPDFTLPSDAGSTLRLSDLRGSPVVLYFYPKDDTPGCTTEACDFRDHSDTWAKSLGAVVLGVSADSVAAHQRFKTKYGLTFPLLSDADRQVMGLYGAYGEKVMYGKTVQGVIRSTFLIDRHGVIVRVWPKVVAKGHVQQVMAALTLLA